MPLRRTLGGEAVKRLFLGIAVALALVGAACGSNDNASSGATTPAASGGSTNPCANVDSQLKTPGQLTVAAEYPYYQPFLLGQQANPTGFEADVINEIAKRAGIDKVVWTNIPFDALYAPGAKQWDLGVSEITITPERAQAVDFSEPYLNADQALLVKDGTPIASATSIADLQQYKLGAEAGTTGLDYMNKTIYKGTGKQASQFDTTDVAAQALKNGTIDGQVIDLPIAAGIVAGSTDVPLKIVAQFKTNEQYGLSFEKGNPLKACVDSAIRSMTQDGTLTDIQNKGLSGFGDLSKNTPVISP